MILGVQTLNMHHQVTLLFYAIKYVSLFVHENWFEKEMHGKHFVTFETIRCRS